MEFITTEGREWTRETMLENLRMVKCPEALAQRVVENRFRPGYSRKQTVSGSSGAHPNPSADLAFKIATLRKAARAMGLHLLEIAKRDCPTCGGDDADSMRMIRGHLDVAGEMLECAASTAETVENLFNGLDDEEDDSVRKLTSPTYQQKRKRVREMHRECHRLLGELCLQHAGTRLSVSEIMD